jgi:hypothetical protein
MRANLEGLESVAWERTHPNHLEGAEIPKLLRDLARGERKLYNLADALLHQDTRFGGAAEAIPFLIELAESDETPDRASLLRLAAGIGAPVEPALRDIPFDRARLDAVGSDELWSEEGELLDGFAAMCAHDGRSAWLGVLSRVSRLVGDPATDVSTTAMCVLAVEDGLPPEHEVRLGRAMAAIDPVCWHAALALGHLAERRSLSAESIRELEKFLAHDNLVHRTAAAFSLAFARDVDEVVFDALGEAQQRFAELSKEECHFDQALMGMVSRAIQRATE